MLAGQAVPIREFFEHKLFEILAGATIGLFVWLETLP